MVVVPMVTEPDDAVIVHVDPSTQVWPFTVVDAFTRSAFVTRPVAVNEPVTTKEGATKAGAVIPDGMVALIDGLPEGPVISTPLLTVVATLWSTPLLL
jgi:hypothetical protein